MCVSGVDRRTVDEGKAAKPDTLRSLNEFFISKVNRNVGYPRFIPAKFSSEEKQITFTQVTEIRTDFQSLPLRSFLTGIAA